MIRDLTNELASKLVGVPYAEVIGGLANVLEYGEEEGRTKRMPYTEDIYVNDDCKVGKTTALVPNSRKKGVIYFEDRGTTFTGRTAHGFTYRSDFRLVLWYNRVAIFGDKNASTTAAIASDLLRKINAGKTHNLGFFARLSLIPQTFKERDKSIFSPYTYSEKETQYLMPPFDYFAIDFKATYSVSANCINELELNPEICY